MWENLAWALTAMGAVIIVLTRVRLADARSGAGRSTIPAQLTNAHLVVGLVALGVWVGYLVTAAEPLAIASLIAWWSEALIGLGLLMRWLPSGGSHSAPGRSDDWGRGPWLSAVAHLGLLAGVALLTILYVVGEI